MDIQKRLLLEQIQLLNRCKLGRKLMHGALPKSVAEFREQVPLTTYADYCPELLEQREDVLPAKPYAWVQSLGRSGEYPHKWVPISHRFWEEASIDFGAMAIFGTCKGRGDTSLKDGFKILHAMAQPPYLTGFVARKVEEDLGFKFLPHLREAEELSFEERVDKGFKLGADAVEIYR